MRMDAKKIDYKDIGFLCGLEIHQRLLTEHKLFCKCPAVINLSSPEVKITRRQRAVAGELGNIDMSASFEEKKSRDFVYAINGNNACLVDIDEEPPGEINRDALLTALSMADALSMKIPYEVQPMRKGVVDGSNPSAFQRTMVVGLDGSIKLHGRTLRIPSISLEEESAGIIKTEQGVAEYDCQRIGIPLIEIDTDQYIKDPEEAKEAALYIGKMMRITGRVQRGIGSIRQDVNVSISDGARVEIKGLQEVAYLDRYVENEVLRQIALTEIKKELKRRRAKVEKAKSLTMILKETKSRLISSNLQSGGAVYGFKLEGFGGLLGKEVNPDRRLGTEISDYAKMAGVKGLIHSDEKLSDYGITSAEEKAIREELGAKKNDAFIIITGEGAQVENAIFYTAGRAKGAIEGVPSETRGVHDTKLFTTKFLRPIPGGARMYPETDVLPVTIEKRVREEAHTISPDIERTLSEFKRELGSEELANQMLASYRLDLYKKLSSETKAEKKFIANILLQKFVELSRNGYKTDSIEEAELVKAFKEYASGQITKKGVEELIKGLAEGGKTSEIIYKSHLKKKTMAEIKQIIEGIKRREPSIPKERIISRVMAEYGTVVDGEEVKDMVE
jgi:glutamyl-tRNA(Gln) amidotransferase, subunit E